MSEEVNEKWDGKERRTVNWDDVVSHIAKTNEYISNNTSSLNELKEKVGKQNGRIGDLEGFRDKALGALYLCGGIGGLIGVFSVIKNLIK